MIRCGAADQNDLCQIPWEYDANHHRLDFRYGR